MSREKKICCICDSEKVPYKCPICRSPYCCLPCYKSHKESRCALAEAEPQEVEKERSEKSYTFPTTDTVAISTLEQLKNSPEIKKCLENPHVRDIARAVLKSNDPTEAIALAMTEPIFSELADACLQLVEPQNTNLAIKETANALKNASNFQDFTTACFKIDTLQKDGI